MQSVYEITAILGHYPGIGEAAAAHPAASRRGIQGAAT